MTAAADSAADSAADEIDLVLVDDDVVADLLGRLGVAREVVLRRSPRLGSAVRPGDTVALLCGEAAAAVVFGAGAGRVLVLRVPGTHRDALDWLTDSAADRTAQQRDDYTMCRWADLLAEARELDRPARAQGLGDQSFAEFLATPAPRWLLDGLLPEGGLCVLAGEPGAGKSLVALDWGLRMAHGIDRWHDRDLRPGPVLMLLGEGMAGTAQRARAWRAAHGAAAVAHKLRVAPLPALDDATALRLIDHYLAEHRPQLAVIDTLSLGLGSADENAAAELSPVLRALGAMRDRYRVSWLLVHHLSKGEPGRSPLARVRGSGALVGAADSVLLLERERDGVLVLRTAKVRDGAGDVPPVRLSIAPIALDDGTSSVHLVAAGPVEAGDVDAAILDLLGLAGVEGLTTAQLADAAGRPRPSVWDTLRRRAGEVVSCSDGPRGRQRHWLRVHAPPSVGPTDAPATVRQTVPRLSVGGSPLRGEGTPPDSRALPPEDHWGWGGLECLHQNGAAS